MAKRPALDLNFRPENCFGPITLEKQAGLAVRGELRRQEALSIVKAKGRRIRMSDIVDSTKEPTAGDFRHQIHPAQLGGEFLPHARPDEVEIARLVLNSVTLDVIGVYASLRSDGFDYRVVDEYDGETLLDRRRRTSKAPLTLGQLGEFLFGAVDVYGILEMNFEDRRYPVEADVFFEGSSEFYPSFRLLIEAWVGEWLATRRAQLEDDEEDI